MPGGEGFDGYPFSLGDFLNNGQGAIDNAFSHVSFAKLRENNIIPDSSDLTVGQDGFHTVARGDEHLSVFDRHKEHDPVILVFFAHSPLLAEFYCIIRWRNAFGGVNDDDGDLCTGFSFQLLQYAVEFGQKWGVGKKSRGKRPKRPRPKNRKKRSSKGSPRKKEDPRRLFRGRLLICLEVRDSMGTPSALAIS